MFTVYMEKKKIRSFTFSFIIYFLLQYKFVNDAWFGTDELDIMALGKGIAHGQLLYRDALSQHMPFSYYISAFFDYIGFKTVDEQRLAFYFIIALLWAFVYVNYCRIINKYVLFFSPIFFCCTLQSIDMGTEILSEHLAGCGAMILLLEYLAFSQNKELKLINYFSLSIAVVLTFGTIFIAIYSLFFIATGVLLLELKWKREEQESLHIWLLNMIKKYVGLVVTVAVPWAVLILYYVYTGTFKEFVFGAYTLNRKYYANYLGGMGSNIFSMFFEPLNAFFSFFTNIISYNQLSYFSVVQLLLVISSIYYIFKIWKDNKKIEAVTIFLFTYSLGIRGIFLFHGTACVEILTFMFADVLFNDVIINKSCLLASKKRKQVFVCIIFAFLFSGYLNNISEIACIKIDDEQMNYEAKVLNAITDENEGIWTFAFCNDLMMLANRYPEVTYPTTPWTWQAYEKRFKKDKKKAGRVLIYSPDFEVWGHRQADYAPELAKYVNKEYTQFEDTYIYIRKDYYEEAINIVDSIDK